MMVDFGDPDRLVVSTMSSEFHVFDHDGMYVDRFRLPPYRGISPAILSSDRLVAYAFQMNGENSRDNHVLAIFDFKGGIPGEVVKFDNMTMHGDHVFFVDPFDQACVYEYTVVDNRD